jgi:hypothetical protein
MRRLVFVLALFISFVGCSKEAKDTACSPGDTACVDGYIHWGGEPAADGSGWNLKTGSEENTTFYILKNLPDDFKTDGLAVTACIEETKEPALCFCGKYYSKIISIKRR